MKRIQFDAVFGIYGVDSFDANTKIIDALDVFNTLDGSHWSGEGTIGTEVDEDIYNRIKEEYGIHTI